MNWDDGSIRKRNFFLLVFVLVSLCRTCESGQFKHKRNKYFSSADKQTNVSSPTDTQDGDGNCTCVGLVLICVAWLSGEGVGRGGVTGASARAGVLCSYAYRTCVSVLVLMLASYM